MSLYEIPIKTAFFYFTIFSFLATVPWVIYQYRKHGFFSFWRSIILFSFIYYCLTAFFLVSLPLPTSRNNIEFKNNIHYQLQPFNLINNFKEIPGFQFNNVKTYLTLFKSFTFLEVLFNVALLFPLGVYLRYFLKKSKKWYLALIISFSVTLFFEVSQLTALFGYYTYPYRLFDVDDLLMNTLGAMIGFFAAPILLLLIPSRDDINEKGSLYTQGKPASYGSQLLELLINLIIASFFGLFASLIIFQGNYLFWCNFVSSFLFIVCIPFIYNGGTFGGKILKIKMIFAKPKHLFSLIVRFVLIYGPITLKQIGEIVAKNEVKSSYFLFFQIGFFSLMLIIWLLFWGSIVIDWLKKYQSPFFNHLSKIGFIRK